MVDEASEAFCKHLDFAFRVALAATRDPAEAEDVVQDAYLRFRASWPSFDRRQPVRPYLASAVVHTAANRSRSDERRRARERNWAEGQDVVASGTRPSAEAVVALRAAVAALPVDERLAVSLRYLEGLSLEETAAALSVPASTASDRVRQGLDGLRKALASAGVGAFAPAALAALPHPAAPAALTAKIHLLAAGKAGIASSAAAAAKGGIAVKIVVGVVAAAALAGGAVVVNRFGGVGAQHAAPLQAPPATQPAAAPADGKPAPANDYKGLQDREEVFEFTEKPKVTKEGDKLVITFASKGKCDATVSIVDKDGKIIRHLASGVLGVNAPWPFQQGSLSQKVEWDGLKDDFSKADAAGCKVRVSLGLKADFDKNILWDPYAMPAAITPPGAKERAPGYLLAKGSDGVRYVGASDSSWCFGRTYDKDGKYVSTFFPPSAAKLEESFKGLTHPFATTIWGDRVLLILPGGFSPGLAHLNPYGDKSKIVKELHHQDGRYLNLATVMKIQPGIGEIKAVPPAEAALPAHKPIAGTTSPKDAKGASVADFFGNYPRIAADRVRDELYMTGPGGVCRLNGKTGERDLTWFPGGLGAAWIGSAVGEVSVGPDGNVYMRSGSFYYGQWLFRLSRDGKPVPFKENAVDIAAANKEWKAKYKQELGAPPLPGMTAIPTGTPPTQCQGMSWGLFVAPNGNILSVTSTKTDGVGGEWMLKNGLVNADGKVPSQGDYLVVVWDKDGKLLTPNAVYRTSRFGQGVAMDRDGNIYRHEQALPPASGGRHAGLADSAPVMRSESSLVKYRGRGGAYPVGTGPADRQKKGEWNANPWILPEPQGLTGSVDLASLNGTRLTAPVKCLGAQWAYPGMWTEPGCTCTHLRWDQDPYARSWLPSTYLFSVVVLDTNGNRIARIGRYGNVDDADPKCGKIHVSWPVATAVSDEALYIMDHGDMRLLRCKLGYAAEETVPLP